MQLSVTTPATPYDDRTDVSKGGQNDHGAAVDGPGSPRLAPGPALERAGIRRAPRRRGSHRGELGSGGRQRAAAAGDASRSRYGAAPGGQRHAGPILVVPATRAGGNCYAAWSAAWAGGD